MLTKDQVLAAMLRECDVCVHLAGKVPQGKADFRFTPPQRSTLELLRYLSFIGVAAARCLHEGKWDAYEALAKEASTLDAAGFPAAMGRQKKALTETFAKIPDADFQSKHAEMPWGQRLPLGQAILELSYACLVAYRMQLFLQAKASGNAAIGTANCWGGMDKPA